MGVSFIVDEYSSEVELRDNHIIWNKDANKAYRFIHREGETEEEAIDQDYDDFYKDEEAGLFGVDKRIVEDEDDEAYQTATCMMPRLLTDKAMFDFEFELILVLPVACRTSTSQSVCSRTPWNWTPPIRISS